MGEESGHPFEEDSCRSLAVRRDLHKKEHSGRKVLGKLEEGKQRDPSSAQGGGGPGEQVAEERRGPGRLQKVKDLLKAKMSLYMHAKSL